MNKCSNCTHFNCYQDGESEPSFGEMVLTSLEWVNECTKKSKYFQLDNPTDCKSFKEIMIKCQGCNTQTPVSKLKGNFCSDDCQHTTIERYVKIKQELSENIIVNKEKMNDTSLSIHERQVVEYALHSDMHYHEQVENMLKLYN